MGSADPRSYSRNKRGIAGQLVWVDFDRNALLDLFHKAAGCYVADVDEIRPQYNMDAPDANALFASSITRGGNVPTVANTISALDNQVSDLYSNVTLASPVYTDQVLPFDITLSGANEYGAMCAAKILGVEILNEVGLSVLGHHISLARGPERRRQMEDGRLFPDGFSSSAVSWPPRCRRCRRRHLSRCCWDAPNRCSGFTGRGLDGLSL